MENKLLPCPFCGGEARLMCVMDNGEEACINYEDELDMGYSFVHCYNCDMDFMPHTETAREVLEAWNTRKPMERIVEQLEKKIDVINNQIDRDSIWGLLGVREGYRDAIDMVKGGVDNAE